MPIPICPFFRNPTGGIWSAESEDRRGISSPLHCERIAIRRRLASAWICRKAFQAVFTVPRNFTIWSLTLAEASC